MDIFHLLHNIIDGGRSELIIILAYNIFVYPYLSKR